MKRSRKAALFGLAVGAASYFGAGKAVEAIVPTEDDFAQMRAESQACASWIESQPNRVQAIGAPCVTFADYFYETYTRIPAEGVRTEKVKVFQALAPKEFLARTEAAIKEKEGQAGLMSPLAEISAAVIAAAVAFDLTRGSGVSH